MRFREFGFLAVLVAAALSVFHPARASAQAWLADRARTEGPGIRVGDLELHPGIGGELGWDSNVYLTADDPNPRLPGQLDSGILRITPHLLVSTIGVERRQQGEQAGNGELPPIQFRGGLSASYWEFFADERRRNVSFDVDLNLRIF
jgi:hypothetical protein